MKTLRCSDEFSLGDGIGLPPPLPLRKNNVVIAVMGPTGVGKSSFIKALTGAEDIVIGHGLTSATSKVQCYNLAHEGTNFLLVDTPGFDDSSGLDNDVVQEILSWLKSSMGEGLLLNGLIYLHRIIDPRITGTARSNMRLFRELCGSDNLHKVVLATTFWAAVDGELGQRREAQLLEDPKFWKPMAEKGSRAFRLRQDRTAYLQILSHIARKNDKFLVQAQQEMRRGQEAHETSAGRAMNLGLERLKQEYEAKVVDERRKQQGMLDEADRRRRAEHRKEQRRLEQQRRREMERLEREAREKDEARRESEARQDLLQKMQREAEEREMRQRLETAAQVLRQRQEEAARLRQLSSYVCKNFDTKRVRCSNCNTRLDLVEGGKWCYREHIPPDPFGLS
ncbi:uncharacterized protein Z519_11814 [Cladophialophora bantiana CBS 173.52]|uniref:G domain-containing protein n=1 Tax=Cladophialophora bantiana (strain ATCC 10958 / CBS 173.52 / CDC B-1940 / NIH 8579) TaxID=1442370 RepID=A0A0D2EBN1_CLAB1|nr:uncharacterized protein Z519_11814 [Cladophialophora bantiana CBS 173.52]KIW87491.1 hypothetical protein Z519_11814 [Cladophialophora bantiana CBS 173.52]